MHIIHCFGAPKQFISDNAGSFSGHEALQFYAQHGIRVTHTTPMRPQGNGKVDKANGVLKAILARILLDGPQTPLTYIFPRAVTIYNRHVSPNGYSPYFLLFGTLPPDEEYVYPEYTREATINEENDWAEELVKTHLEFELKFQKRKKILWPSRSLNWKD